MYPLIKTSAASFQPDADTINSLMPASFSYKPFFKRSFDLLLCLLFLPLALPLLLLLILFIKLDSKGSAVYKSKRIGKDGRVFNCLKLRTMCQNAEEVLKNLLEDDDRLKNEYLKFRKLKKDPRVTRVGRLLRASSLDELPQIFNVLKGEMSFVGPRPIVEEEIPKYGKSFPIYTSMKPGITGLWQIKGRNETPFQGRVELDLNYFENTGILNDLKILIKTVPVVLSKKGAY